MHFCTYLLVAAIFWCIGPPAVRRFLNIGDALHSFAAWVYAQRCSLHFCFFLAVQTSVMLFLHFLPLWLRPRYLQPRSEVTKNRCGGAGADWSGCLSTFVSPAVNLAQWANSLFYCSLREWGVMLSCFVWQLQFCNDLEQVFSNQTATTEAF